MSLSFILLAILGQACTKEEVVDERPDFIFQGTLTDVTDGTPKDGWTVALTEDIPIYERPQGWFAPTSFGFDTVRSGGHFSMDVNAYTELGLNETSSAEAKREYYSRYLLTFCGADCFHWFSGGGDHIYPDPDDLDLKLDEFDFSSRGEVITRNVKVFTGDFGRVTYRYLIERENTGTGAVSGKTTFRDLAFGKPYLTVNANIYGSVEVGGEYERRINLPVGRPVEAITRFETTTVGSNLNLLVNDSLVFRDTLLMQTASDTLQLRSYVY